MFEWLYNFIMWAMSWFMSLFGYEMPLLQQHSAEEASKEEVEVQEQQEQQEQDVKEVQQEVQKVEEKVSE